MMALLFILVGMFSIECLHATPKYSIPMDKSQKYAEQPMSNLYGRDHESYDSQKYVEQPMSNRYGKDHESYDSQKYVEQPMSSRYGKDHESYEHYYPAYEHYYSGKGHSLLPYIVGGFGIGILPLLTLMMTLAVNIAPAATIPTAITTATGKFFDSFNSTQLLADLREELWKRLN